MNLNRGFVYTLQLSIVYVSSTRVKNETKTMEHTFETLCDAIQYVFKQEETSVLLLDKICEILESPNFFINSKTEGLVPTSTITRRRISSTLSSSDLFVKAGPPRTCLWAIRPNNPSFISDGAIGASIEQMLVTNGPMTLQQFVEKTDLSGAHLTLFKHYLGEHQDEFSQLEDTRWWFTNQPLPLRRDFDNLSHAMINAFEPFQNGATVEEIHWYMCLSTVSGKLITRRSISRELSRRPDLFQRLSRAKYDLTPSKKEQLRNEGHIMPLNMYVPPPPPPPPPRPLQPSRGVLPIPQISMFPRDTNPYAAIATSFDEPPHLPEDDCFDPESFFDPEFVFNL